MENKQMRMAMLIASGLIHSGCSAEDQPSETSNGGNIPVTRLGVGATVQNLAIRTGPGVTLERILISSDAGQVTAELVDNAATRRLVRMLPVTIEMRDHLRQEKTGTLPFPLPNSARQTVFSAGTLGLWGNDNFVIYYRVGSVPTPGIVVLGRLTGDVSVFDRPGRVSASLERAK